MSLEVVDRIRRIYQSSTEEERYYFQKILEEFALYGDSPTYNDIWLSDYREIPVDIDTFICHDQYLGRATRNGDAVYPFWKRTLHDIFDAGNKYEEIFLTGATRIGKSSTAITGCCYMLYKLMCLRDPQKFFNKKDVSKFSILFFNITKDMAAGVAFREFNDTLKSSPWFDEHGTFSKSERNFYYIPEGDKVVIDFGSDAAHGLGKQVYCLTGDTQIITDSGYRSLEGIYNDGGRVVVAQYCGDSICYAPADVVLTKHVSEIIRVTLEDGSVIEGTPEHLVMLSDGSYKKLGELSSSDDLLTLDNVEVDQMNLVNPDSKFVVYRHISPCGKQYVGITSRSVTDRWGTNGSGYRDNKHFWAAICKYGWDSFVHEIIATDLSLADACNLECQLIDEFDLMNPDNGYNQTSGGEHSTPSESIRNVLRTRTAERWSDPDYRQNMINKLRGHAVSDVTKQKISAAKLGVRHMRPSSLRGRKLSAEHVLKLKSHSSWNRGLTRQDHPALQTISDKLSGRVKSADELHKLSESRIRQYQQGYAPIWINDGQIETTIDSSCQTIPQGFVSGRLNKNYRYIHKDDVMRKVPAAELSQWLGSGWELGRGNLSNLKKATQKYIWIFDGHEFSTAEDLAAYLRDHGFSDIVASTVTNLYRTGFHTSRKYAALANRVIRKDVFDEGC